MNNYNNFSQLQLFQHQEFMIIRFTGAALVAFLGTILNIFTVLTILLYGRPLTIQNRLMLNLYFNNLIFCVYVLPVYIFDLYYNIYSAWGIFCRIQGFIYIFIPCNILLAYLHVTLHRYFAVVFALKANGPSYGSCKKTCIILGFSSFVVFLCMLPGLLNIWGGFGRSVAFGTCTLLTENGDKSFNLYGQAMAIFLPLVVMIYCYSHILYKVKTQVNKIHPMMTMNSEMRAQEAHLTAASVCIVTVFFISFIPTFLADQIPSLVGVPSVQALCGMIAFAHAITDPIIYTTFDRKKKKDMKKLFENFKCRK